VTYLLDTDTVSFAIRGVGRVGERLLQTGPSQVALSTVTEAELWFGAEKRRSKRLFKLVEDFLDPLKILPFDRSAAQAFGKLRAQLEARGRSIGVADTMIAATAIAQGLVVVTGNTKHFARIRGLKVEDWR